MKNHPKATFVVVACVFAWALNMSVGTRRSERLLGAAIRVGFELLDGEDMLVGIG